MISKDEAIEIATKRANENGWGFVEPIDVVSRRNWSGETVKYEIESLYGQLGTKCLFTIDAITGEILSEGYIPR